MKLFYSYLLLFMGIMGFALPQQAMAQTTTEDIDMTFCLQIEDPSLCYVQNSNNERVELVKGENVFTTKLHKTTYSDGGGYAYSDTYYLYIESDKQNDYRITACDIEVGGTKSPYSNFYSSTTSMSIYFNSQDMDGCTLYPTISNLNDLRTATATVTVDDASKVQISCGSNGYTPTLQNGENTINFDPVNEANWTIGAKNYGEYLGGVKQNGNTMTDSYGRFYLTVAQGDNIEITAEASLEPVKVTFTGNVEAITNVCKYINYAQEAIDGDWKEGFEVAPRTQIIVSLDCNNYKVSSVTVNGNAQYISDNLYITISDVTEIAVTAEKYATFSLPLEITDPAHITVAVAESQYSGSTELTGLVAGLQTLEISNKNSYMIVNKKDGFAIDKVAYVVADEETVVEAGYGGYYIPLTGTEKVIVVSHEIVRNDVATLWINDMTKCYTFYMQRSDNSYCFHNSYEPNPVPVTGEQTFKFDAETDNPISLYFSPTDYNNPGYVTVNDVKVDPVYSGSTNYTFELKNGDVVKVYMCEETPTGIESIQASRANGKIYNMMGVEVKDASKAGAYIINGKKVVIK